MISNNNSTGSSMNLDFPFSMPTADNAFPLSLLTESGWMSKMALSFALLDVVLEVLARLFRRGGIGDKEG